jgi:hypothetical protein
VRSSWGVWYWTPGNAARLASDSIRRRSYPPWPRGLSEIHWDGSMSREHRPSRVGATFGGGSGCLVQTQRWRERKDLFRRGEVADVWLTDLLDSFSPKVQGRAWRQPQRCQPGCALMSSPFCKGRLLTSYAFLQPEWHTSKSSHQVVLSGVSLEDFPSSLCIIVRGLHPEGGSLWVMWNRRFMRAGTCLNEASTVSSWSQSIRRREPDRKQSEGR